MNVEGRCLCGQVTFSAEVNPKHTTICHCTDCQQQSGTAFRVVAIARAENFSLQSGETHEYIKTADSGAKRALHFCPNCGTNLFGTSTDSEPPVYSLRVGTLDRRNDLPPLRQIWCDSAVPWIPDFPTDKRPHQ